MALDRDFLALVIDALAPLGGVTWRPMFGGAGIYRDGLFFALIGGDDLCFRVDDATRLRYQAAGSHPFTTPTFRSEKYWAVPLELLDEPETLREWALAALDVAGREARARGGLR